MIFRIAALSIFLLVFIAGCKEESGTVGPGSPVPAAAFEYRGALVTRSMISFINRSEGAVSYAWDFGDGTFSTAVNPLKRYQLYGQYKVTLTAVNEAQMTNSVTRTLFISPGTCRITKIEIDTLPLVTPGNISWDEADGPDLFCTIGDSSRDPSLTLITTRDTPANNVDSASFPVVWTLPRPVLIGDWETPLYLHLWDIDGAADTYIGGTRGFSLFAMAVTRKFKTTLLVQDLTLSIQGTIHLEWQ